MKRGYWGESFLHLKNTTAIQYNFLQPELNDPPPASRHPLWKGVFPKSSLPKGGGRQAGGIVQ